METMIPDTHTHTRAGVLHDLCPWCDQPISHEKFVEIKEKIQKEEERKLAALRAQLQAEFGAAKKAAQARADAKVARIVKEKDAALVQLRKESATREASIREAAKKEAELTLKPELEKYRKLAQQRQTESAAARKKITELEATVRQLPEHLKKSHQAELVKQRELLEKARDRAVLKQSADFNREREGYQARIKDLDRKLERKTAHELGEGAEIDLLEELRDTFTDDRVTPVPKGTPGADIHHEVLYKGEVCGRIVFDSKNRQGWQNAYVKKLREDQLAADADHAILSSTVFPSGRKQLCIEDGVIVANPARVIALVQLLRSQMLLMHKLRLSNQQRAKKTERLYEFLTSEHGMQLLDRADELSEKLLQIDVDEVKAHEKVWKNRGRQLRSLQKTIHDFDAEVSAIIEA